MIEREFCAVVDFVPIGAWRKVRDDEKAKNEMLDAMTKVMVEKIPPNEGWNADWRAHNGPERDEPGLGHGVRVVLRAWRFQVAPAE